MKKEEKYYTEKVIEEHSLAMLPFKVLLVLFRSDTKSFVVRTTKLRHSVRKKYSLETLQALYPEFYDKPLRSCGLA